MATVLVVDDDANNRLLVKTVAQHGGYTILEAEDGEAALRICISQRPDLIVLDLSLPKMDGTEFLRRLRGDERTRALRVALYSATQPTPAMRDFMEIYSVQHLIGKPVEPDDLLHIIQEAIAR
jgi:diguanylate cyclase